VPHPEIPATKSCLWTYSRISLFDPLFICSTKVYCVITL
jgi:hypothetical protein